MVLIVEWPKTKLVLFGLAGQVQPPGREGVVWVRHEGPDSLQADLPARLQKSSLVLCGKHITRRETLHGQGTAVKIRAMEDPGTSESC
jgi:hypothetical protein